MEEEYENEREKGVEVSWILAVQVVFGLDIWNLVSYGLNWDSFKSGVKFLSSVDVGVILFESLQARTEGLCISAYNFKF